MKTHMSKLVLAVSFILIFALQGCEREDKLRLRFYYQNNSDRTILINHYRNNRALEYFKLAPQDSVLFLNIITEEGKNHQPTDFDKFLQQNSVIDSVYILFDSERLQRYTLRDGKVRSVLKMENYQSREKGKNDFEFVYEFTKADFDSAGE